MSSQHSNTSLTIVSYVLMTFLGYFCIGLPLAVLPIYIHQNLGYSAFIAGIVISLQYFVTFIIRGWAGTIVDKRGPQPAVMVSMFSFVLSGVLLLIGFLLSGRPVWSLVFIILARLMTGCAEGMIGASPISWAMLVVGRKHTGTVISYNGIASYGALALGAPLGVILSNSWGNASLGVTILFVGIFGFFYGKKKKNIIGGGAKDTSLSFLKVLKIVSPYGTSLALGGIGFGCLSTFITLYYEYMHWDNAALCLTSFSVLFILGRLFFGNSIQKRGGLQVALFCLLVESLGLAMIWLAPTPVWALFGASVTGLGFSLVFPALGVEAVRLAPAANQGSALAAYGLFIDISLGITGPLIGFVAGIGGMHSIFSFSMVMVFIGFLLILYILLMVRKGTAVLEKKG
ncbi:MULTISPECIES: MFS transporter [Chitinophagaceae]